MNNFPNQLDKFTIGEKISQKIVTEKRMQLLYPLMR
jgi:hypothetical protein